MRLGVMGQLAKLQILDRAGDFGNVEVEVVNDVDSLRSAVTRLDGLAMPGSIYDAQTAEILGGDTSLVKWVQFLTAGYENATRFGIPKGIVLTNAGDAWSNSVAEHSMALLLSLARRIDKVVTYQAQRLWERSFYGDIVPLDGLTMVIVGYGSIGRNIAKRAVPFGISVIGVRRNVPAGPSTEGDGIELTSDLNSALARADIIVIAVPHSDASTGLFNANTFEHCKPGAILINVARGAVVETSALLNALRSGRLRAAGLDVTDPEPLPPNDELWIEPNVLITPHIAGAAGSTVHRRLAEVTCLNAARLADGFPLHHVVSL